jgi:hypothetical protein
MLAEMLEMLAQMLGPLRCRLLRLSAVSSRCRQKMMADVAGLGRCYWQMLADDAGLGRCCWQNGATPEIERIEARIEAIEVQ